MAPSLHDNRRRLWRRRYVHTGGLFVRHRHWAAEPGEGSTNDPGLWRTACLADTMGKTEGQCILGYIVEKAIDRKMVYVRK